MMKSKILFVWLRLPLPTLGIITVCDPKISEARGLPEDLIKNAESYSALIFRNNRSAPCSDLLTTELSYSRT